MLYGHHTQIEGIQPLSSLDKPHFTIFSCIIQLSGCIIQPDFLIALHKRLFSYIAQLASILIIVIGHEI